MILQIWMVLYKSKSATGVQTVNRFTIYTPTYGYNDGYGYGPVDGALLKLQQLVADVLVVS